MKMKTVRLLRTVAVLLLALSVGGCMRQTDINITGTAEDGILTVWVGPNLFQQDIEQIANHTAFPSEIQFVNFDTKEELQHALNTKIRSGEGPDLILANMSDIDVKTLDADLFMNLNPFLDYEEKQENGLKRENILPTLLKMGVYNDKLVALPLEISFGGYSSTKWLDENYGLNFENNHYTPEQLFEKIDKWNAANKKEDYYLFDKLPTMFAYFNNLIDFENKTTKLNEDIVYKYYCRYLSSATSDFELNNLVWSIAHAEGRDSAFMNDLLLKKRIAYLDNQSGLSLPDAADGKPSYSFAGADNTDDQLIILPYPTDSGQNKYLLRYSVLGFIPANVQRPNKAFQFIKTVYSPNYIEYQNPSSIPPLLSELKQKIDTQYYNLTSKERDAMYHAFADAKFTYYWDNTAISEIFSEMQVNYRKTKKLPTREEWNAAVKKVKLILDE